MAREDLSTATTSVSADKAAGHLLIERTFDAPRDLVWKAFTDPTRVAQWWGPRGWNTTNKTMDVKVGGIWHYCMTGPDGTESWGKAAYKEIVPPDKIVYVDTFSDADGNDAPGMPAILITWTFTEADGKTTITSTGEFGSAGELESVLGMGMVQGMSETWDRLAEYLEGAK